MKLKIFHDKDRNQTWCCVIDPTGFRNDNRPVVKFYDCRYEHTDYGQFVSSYYVSTLLEDYPHRELCGLTLDAGIPEWQISTKCTNRIRQWLKEIEK